MNCLTHFLHFENYLIFFSFFGLCAMTKVRVIAHNRANAYNTTSSKVYLNACGTMHMLHHKACLYFSHSNSQ